MSQIPDPKMHLRISMIKSTLRIIAGVQLVMGFFVAAGVLLILAEVLGIAEELV